MIQKPIWLKTFCSPRVILCQHQKSVLKDLWDLESLGSLTLMSLLQEDLVSQ